MLLTSAQSHCTMLLCVQLNGGWNNWVGDSCASGCLFDDDLALLFSAIDELCAVVVNEFGKLCTTTLADVPVPSTYQTNSWVPSPCAAADAESALTSQLGVSAGTPCNAAAQCPFADCAWAADKTAEVCPRAGSTGADGSAHDDGFIARCCCSARSTLDGAARWVELIETLSNASSIGVWTTNVYRAQTFGTLFEEFESVSGKPLLVTEYGVDAFDMVTSSENEALAAEWTRALMLELEAHSVTCTHGCAPHAVASGGAIMSWVDEWYKGHHNINACARDRRDPSNPRCELFWCSSQPAHATCTSLLANSGGQPAVSCDADANPADCARFWVVGEYDSSGCPDYESTRHSSCGTFVAYSQPDDWLNEEWWGIMAMAPCSETASRYEATRLRPRSLFYALKAAWSLGSGCVVHASGVNGNTALAAPFDPLIFPGCGALLTELTANVSMLLDGASSIFSRLPGSWGADSDRPIGSVATARASYLNHTAAMLLAPPPPPASLTADQLAALSEAAALVPNATCLAMLATMELLPLEHDGCSVQAYAHCLYPQACPLRAELPDDLNGTVSPHAMGAYVERQRAAHLSECPPTPPPAIDSPPPEPPLGPPEPPAIPEGRLGSGRLTIQGRSLYLDGALWIMRGICYSPSRWGDDPGYSEPHGDYFVTVCCNAGHVATPDTLRGSIAFQPRPACSHLALPYCTDTLPACPHDAPACRASSPSSLATLR